LNNTEDLKKNEECSGCNLSGSLVPNVIGLEVLESVYHVPFFGCFLSVLRILQLLLGE